MLLNQRAKITNPIEKHLTILTPYHYYVFSIIFASKCPLLWHVLNLIYITPPMDYFCNDDYNVDTTNLCPCDDVHWNTSVFEETVQTKYTIVCEDKWLITVSQNILFVGSALGCVVFEYLADNKWPLFWHILNLIFLAPPTDYQCEDSGIRGDPKNFCPCEKVSWNRSVFTVTMQMKYNIVCDDVWLVNLAHSMSFTGALIGSLAFGALSDMFGRLNIFSFSCFLVGFAGCLVIWMPTAASFICMRFFEGFGVGGTIVTSYVICMEYSGVKYREIISALFHIPINIGHITLPGISYLLRDLHDFQLTISLPIMMFGVTKWLIMETPKWLMDNGKTDHAVSVIEKIIGHDSQENLKEELEAFNVNRELEKRNKRKERFWDIFKHKQLTINLICMCVIYFVCGMGYYGVSQFIGQMSGDIHLNVMLSGLLLVPGTLLCIFLLPLISRRNFLIISSVISGVFMLAVICIPSNLNWLRVSFACICNCFFFTAFIVAMLYGVELFPTSIRSSTLGMLSVLARLGQIVNPSINAFSENIAGAIYGTLAIVGGVLCCFLPETKNTELPSTFEDLDKLTLKHNGVNQDGGNQDGQASK